MALPRRILLLTTLPPVLAIYLFYTFQLHQHLLLLPYLLHISRSIQLVLNFPSLFFTTELTGKGRAESNTIPNREEVSDQSTGAAGKPFVRHIVAVGDLHGDLLNAKRVLRFAGVVDDSDNWTGHADFFVQTGDIIDRGDDTIALFTWMDQLRTQAAATGATMLSHLGNHEWMNAIGDWRYVYPSEIKTFGTVAARQEMLSTGAIGRSWAANYTTTSRLPLHPFLGPPNTPFPPSSMSLHYQKDDDSEPSNDYYYNPDEPLSHAALSFVHGGLSPTYKQLTPFPSRINELSDSLLSKLQNREQPPPHPPHHYPGLPPSKLYLYTPGTTEEEEELYSSNGPLWYRGWALDNEETACIDVEKVLAQTGTRRMIMGHTPDFTGIVSRCNGKVIIIDTGISHAYGGVLSALSIHYSLTPMADSSNSEGKQRWQEKEVVRALYEDNQEVLVEEERELFGNFRVY